MLTLKERILMAMQRNGVLSFGQMHELFPVQSVTHLAEMLAQLVADGEISKRLDTISSTTWYYKRFYTGSGDHIVFHHLDHPHPERFLGVPLLDELPWFFEPIEHEGDAVYSPIFPDPAAALAAAEDKEKESRE